MSLFSSLLAPKATPPREWWIAPSPDMPADPIVGTADRVQRYQQNLLAGVDPRFYAETDPPTHLSVECGVLRPGVPDVSETIQQAADTLAATPVDWFCMDEPFLRGSQTGLSVLESTNAITQWITAVKRLSPLTKIALIEPYPFWPIEQLVGFATSLPIDALHLDVDINLVKGDRKWHGQRLQSLVTTLHKPLGVILWGRDEPNLNFLKTGRDLFDFYHSAFTKQWPHRVIVQSWRFGASNSDLVALLGYARNRV